MVIIIMIIRTLMYFDIEDSFFTEVVASLPLEVYRSVIYDIYVSHFVTRDAIIPTQQLNLYGNVVGLLMQFTPWSSLSQIIQLCRDSPRSTTGTAE